MKYFFIAVAFFCLGYVIPIFPVFFQWLLAAMLLAIVGVMTWFFVDLRGFGRLFDAAE